MNTAIVNLNASTVHVRVTKRKVKNKIVAIYN